MFVFRLGCKKKKFHKVARNGKKKKHLIERESRKSESSNGFSNSHFTYALRTEKAFNRPRLIGGDGHLRNPAEFEFVNCAKERGDQV